MDAAREVVEIGGTEAAAELATDGTEAAAELTTGGVCESDEPAVQNWRMPG